MTRTEIKSNRRPSLMTRLKHQFTFPDLSEDVLGDWDCSRARMPRVRN